MIMLDVRTLKERLQWLLAQKHMSASELSQKAGLARGHVGLIKSEKIKEPDEATVAQIARALRARAPRGSPRAMATRGPSRLPTRQWPRQPQARPHTTPFWTRSQLRSARTRRHLSKTSTRCARW